MIETQAKTYSIEDSELEREDDSVRELEGAVVLTKELEPLEVQD